jgi:hypothetical protein
MEREVHAASETVEEEEVGIADQFRVCLGADGAGRLRKRGSNVASVTEAEGN